MFITAWQCIYNINTVYKLHFWIQIKAPYPLSSPLPSSAYMASLGQPLTPISKKPRRSSLRDHTPIQVGYLPFVFLQLWLDGMIDIDDICEMECRNDWGMELNPWVRVLNPTVMMAHKVRTLSLPFFTRMVCVIFLRLPGFFSVMTMLVHWFLLHIAIMPCVSNFCLLKCCMQYLYGKLANWQQANPTTGFGFVREEKKRKSICFGK